MQKKQNEILNKYYLFCFSAAIIWAFVVVPIRQLNTYNPFDILISRIFLIPILMFGYIFLFAKKKLIKDIKIFNANTKVEKKKIIILVVASGLCLALNWFTYIYLVAKIDVKSASLVYVICPLLIAIGSFIIYKDKIDKYKIISLLLATIVIITMSLNHFNTIIYVLFCTIAYAVFVLLQKSMPNFNKFNLFAFEALCIFILLIPIFILKLKYITSNIDFYFWSRLLIIAFFFTIFPMILNLSSIEKLPASTVAIITYMNPILSFLIGVFVFNEILFSKDIIEYSILLLSIIIFNIEKIKTFF